MCTLAAPTGRLEPDRVRGKVWLLPDLPEQDREWERQSVLECHGGHCERPWPDSVRAVREGEGHTVSGVNGGLRSACLVMILDRILTIMKIADALNAPPSLEIA